MAVDVATLPPSRGSNIARETRSNRVLKAIRARDVITMMVQGGYSDEEIADLLTEEYATKGEPGITRRQVTNIRKKSLEAYKPSATQIDEVRGQQLQRLDALLEAAMPHALAGKVRHIETVLKIEGARAELMGTKAPKKIEHGGRVDHVHDIADPDEVNRLQDAFVSSFAIEGEAFELPALEAGDDAVPTD
jgi:hypothetical protein